MLGRLLPQELSAAEMFKAQELVAVAKELDELEREASMERRTKPRRPQKGQAKKDDVKYYKRNKKKIQKQQKKYRKKNKTQIKQRYSAEGDVEMAEALLELAKALAEE